MMKKFLTMLLCLVVSFSAVACGGNNSDGPKEGQVVLEFRLPDTGIGTEWLKAANTRFMAENEHTKYGDKEGVYCKIVPGDSTFATMASDGYHVYFNERNERISNAVKTGNLLNIDEIARDKYDERDGVKLSMDDKIPEEYKSYFQSVEGEYYALPYNECYAGLTYDKRLFDQYGYYFAQPGKGNVYNCPKYGTNYEFIRRGDNASKSCGPDGELGTVDDGLPSSLFELLTLCEKLKTTGVSPFGLTGEHLHYGTLLLGGIFASMQGFERARGYFDLEGTIDIIVGFTNENLLGNISYLKKPIVKSVEISEETGYYISQSVEKYYAYALLEIIEREGYWSKEHSKDTYSHIMAQKEFIYSGYGQSEKIGMLIEASYWYNESTIRDNFTYFYIDNDVPNNDREVAWMNLPVNIANTVTGEDKMADVPGVTGLKESVKGEPPVLLDVSRSVIVFNKRVTEDPAVYEALVDWIYFFNSDVELSNYTIESGMAKPYNYEVNEADASTWNSFEKGVWDLRKNANVIRFEGDNETFRQSGGYFHRGFNDGQMLCHQFANPLDCFDAPGNEPHAKECFVNGILTKADWQGMYQGTGTVGEIPGANYVG